MTERDLKRVAAPRVTGRGIRILTHPSVSAPKAALV
ncbi:MAG: hypothetical protein QOD13_3448 [Thermoleophilaceae bacterium]|nr:hypothetical protein [Thermoleophilaceae bacterium]